MIALIRGHLIIKSPQFAVVDVNGIGYKVFISLSTFPRLPDHKEEIILHTYTHIREDALQLYGFLSGEERDFFTTLLAIGGIGPKMALNILSGASLTHLMEIVDKGDVERLSMIPGVGKKTAARIVLELKEKLIPVSPSSDETGRDPRIAADAVSALINLGYTRARAREAIDKAWKAGEQVPLEDVIRNALKVLGSK